MFDKESFKKYISAGSSNPIYYFKRRRSSYELPSSPIGDERSVPEFKKERKCLNRTDTFSELIQLSLKIYF